MKVYNGTLSSSNLYHFTREKKFLKSILENGFYPRTSIENLSFLMHNYTRAFIGVPMVCFCDIPINLIEEHTNQYGRYGIGLSKEWGIRNGLNPVQYILDRIVKPIYKYDKIKKINEEDWTLMSNKLLNLENVITNHATRLDVILDITDQAYTCNINVSEPQKDKDGNEFRFRIVETIENCMTNLAQVGNAFWSIAGYYKLYTDNYTDKPYYDEREWRYVIEFSNLDYFNNRVVVLPDVVEKYINEYNSNIDKFIPKDYASYSPEEKEQFDKKLKEEGNFKDLISLIKEDKEIKEQVSDLNSKMEKNPLKFTIKDIEEIILTDSDNIEEFINGLDIICNKKISNNDKQSLREKIKIL